RIRQGLPQNKLVPHIPGDNSGSVLGRLHLKRGAQESQEASAQRISIAKLFRYVSSAFRAYEYELSSYMAPFGSLGKVSGANELKLEVRVGKARVNGDVFKLHDEGALTVDRLSYREWDKHSVHLSIVGINHLVRYRFVRSAPGVNCVS